ncbi:hypothetical protein FHR62_002546 [Xanthomonas arboricola]|nr:hypothetical protein [Xanthomonas arboricola]
MPGLRSTVDNSGESDSVLVPFKRSLAVPPHMLLSSTLSDASRTVPLDTPALKTCSGWLSSDLGMLDSFATPLPSHTGMYSSGSSPGWLS